MQINKIFLSLALIFSLALSFISSQAAAFDFEKIESESKQDSLQESTGNEDLKETPFEQDANQDHLSKTSVHKVTIREVNSARFTNIAVLQALNKVTAKSSNLEVKVGEEIEFGKLVIKAKKCWKSPADQRPENKILLEIMEVSNEGIGNPVFNGWMFSSSPSVSNLENAIYDVIAVECKN
ncbi:MAG: hypothetical protein ACI9TO_000200 [Rickettsiales bacterium]|jgi:hypothetical protein